MLFLFVVTIPDGISFAGDDTFTVSAYYVKGQTELKDGEKEKISFSWQGAGEAVQRYKYTLYEGRCTGVEDCASRTVIEGHSGETLSKRHEIDQEACPGWDCTLGVEAVNKEGNKVYAYASPESFEPTLPLIIVETEDQIPVCEEIGSSGPEESYKIDGCYNEMDCSIRILKPNRLGSQIVYATEYEGDSEKITINGNSSRSFPKRQYGIELDKDKSLFGMRKDDDWRLNGSWLDRSFIRNKLSYDRFAGMNPDNNFGAQTRYAELFINGEYRGVYILTEKVGRTRTSEVFPGLEEAAGIKGGGFLVDISKIGIDKRGIYDFMDQEYDFLCPEYQKLSWNAFFYELDFPKESDLNMFRELDVVRVLSDFHKTAVSDAFSDEKTGIFSFLDRASAIDFIILHEWSKNNDAFFGNFKMVRPKGDSLRFIIWDMDLAFGNRTILDREDPGLPTYEGFSHRPQLFYRIQRVEGFHGMLVDRWKQIRENDTLMGTVGLMKDIDCLTGGGCSDETRVASEGAVLSREAVDRNFIRWPIDDAAYEEVADLNGFLIYEVVDYPSEVTLFKWWLENRMEYLDDDKNWAKLLERAKLREKQSLICVQPEAGR